MLHKRAIGSNVVVSAPSTQQERGKPIPGVGNPRGWIGPIAHGSVKTKAHRIDCGFEFGERHRREAPTEDVRTVHLGEVQPKGQVVGRIESGSARTQALLTIYTDTGENRRLVQELWQPQAGRMEPETYFRHEIIANTGESAVGIHDQRGTERVG